jgi:hypothetical protein
MQHKTTRQMTHEVDLHATGKDAALDRKMKKRSEEQVTALR